jgi:RepB DNA-primase N-terminal domain
VIDMTTTTTTRHETTVRFLAALVGTAQRGELLELRYRLEDGQRMGQVFDRPDRVRGLATRAIFLGRRTDVYVGCAPRTRRHGGRDAVDRAFVLWADCDGEGAVAALAEFEPAPAIVIASGSGSNCHAYWPLAEPLARDEVERANRRLAHALGADPASADAARILRVPGTRSWKHDPPTAVDAIRLDTDRRLDADDVVGSLPDPPAPAPARTTIVPVGHRGDDPLLAIAPDVYVPRLLGVNVPRHRKVPCPFHEDMQASLHVYETAERGWYCFGRCRRGGTIYDLAGPLYGYGARGEDFLRLRAELRSLFGLEAS